METKKEFKKGQKVQFLKEFGRFVPNDYAWVMKVEDPEHVSVVNKGDDYCATDSCIPFIHEENVPTNILKIM